MCSSKSSGNCKALSSDALRILLPKFVGSELRQSRSHVWRRSIMLMFFSFVLFYTVLTNERMKKIFSNKYLTLIGGMCYSIYLLHFGILSASGKLLQNTGLSLSNYNLIPLYFILFTVAILILSGIYFLLVEKPFMKMVIRK